MPLRRSLQIYVLRLYGVILDDFNYNRLNYYLTLMHKVFIKKLVCKPEEILRIDVKRVCDYDEFCVEGKLHYDLFTKAYDNGNSVLQVSTSEPSTRKELLAYRSLTGCGVSEVQTTQNVVFLGGSLTKKKST